MGYKPWDRIAVPSTALPNSQISHSTFLHYQVPYRLLSMPLDIPEVHLKKKNHQKVKFRDTYRLDLLHLWEGITWVVQRATVSLRLYRALLAGVHWPPSILWSNPASMLMRLKLILCFTEKVNEWGERSLTQQRRKSSHRYAKTARCLPNFETQSRCILEN